MAVLAVRLWPDPVLSRVAEPVTESAAARGLAADMLDTMYHAQGRGLAAPQVGVTKRLIVMDCMKTPDPPRPLILFRPEAVTAPEDDPTPPARFRWRRRKRCTKPSPTT